MDKDDPVLYEIIRLNQKEIIKHSDIKNLEKTYLEERVKLFRDEHKLNILSDKYSALKSLSKKIISRYAHLLDTSLQLSDINKKILTLQEINEKIKNLSDHTKETKTDIIQEENNKVTLSKPLISEPISIPQLDNEKDKKKIEELEKIIKELKQENITLQIDNKNSRQDRKVKFEEDEKNIVENQESIFNNNNIYNPKISFEIKLEPVYEDYREDDYKSQETKYKTIDSEQYDENTNESYDVEEEEEDEEHHYNIDESLEDDGDKRFCEHLMYLYEEIQFITYDKTIAPDKKYLQIMDMYRAYKKYLSYYVNKERLDYIDKMIDELNIPNLEEKNIVHFYDEINNLIFDPFLIIE